MSSSAILRFKGRNLSDSVAPQNQIKLEISGNIVDANFSWDNINDYLKSLSEQPTYLVLAEGELSLFEKDILDAIHYLDQNPNVAFIYGQYFNEESQAIVERSIFDSHRILNQNYFGDLGIIRTELFFELVTNSLIPEIIPIWGLAVLLNNSDKKIEYFPRKLYSAHKGSSSFTDLEKESISTFFSQLVSDEKSSRVVSVSDQGIVEWEEFPENNFLVSIVIPSQGQLNGELGSSFLYRSISSISELTTYPNYEVVLVLDLNYSEELLEEIKKILGAKLRVLVWEKPFNFSQKMNFGVQHSSGEFVLLLNDDIQVISPNWIQAMLKHATKPSVGMVGAMLYYEDDTIQHAGHAYFNGSPTHLGLGLPRGSRGPGDALLVERRVSGVTAACSLMRKSVFFQAGGFTPQLPGNFNDVDLCMKVSFLGFDILWTPRAELYHFESKSRDARVRYFELDFISARWKSQLHDVRFWPFHPFASDV